MQITAVQLNHFRNHANLRLDTDAHVVAIVGPNGSGKTNILEAISLFAPGRGMRSAETAELQMRGTDNGWGTQLEIQNKNDAVQLSTGITPGQSRRSILINGGTAAQSDLRDYISILFLTPEDDFVLGRGVASRRALLDRFVTALDPVHAGRLQQLQKSLSERLRILQMSRADQNWLTAIEKEIAERGTAVAAARLAFLEQLSPQLEAAINFPRAITSIAGDIETALLTLPALAVEENYARQLTDARTEDTARGQTAYGAHRADWRITYAGKNQPAENCSTGEQKALLFSLFLATARLVKAHQNRPPVLLLDECLSHLDEQRRRLLLEALNGLGSQSFWTGTELNMLENHANMKVIQL